ncbi:zinc-binding alcohol dehydrogenase [Paenibacillus sp. HJGM_3]|uniref:zinc-dependent alcohol dehydrogenase n=1 Tax=Paenibacillus sp. HJGM_3 TaxID=3379816 RepID=UPI00385C194E
MKAVVSQLGKVSLMEHPIPELKKNHVLVKTCYSTVSPGTELTSIKSMREHPTPIGYSASGIAIDIGEGVSGIEKDQPVACYGGPFVRHSEYILVPKQLVAPVPSSVNLSDASTVGIGVIAMHALRLSGLQFGESAVVIGLGIIGQLLCRIAASAGIHVIAVDLLPNRRAALSATPYVNICAGTEEVPELLRTITRGIGADAVFHCIGGKQKELLDNSFKWLRDRGKMIIVGDLQMEFTRSAMFHKEAQLIVSRAGGPGRYDEVYEKDGIDYPSGYVRWTEGRNMQAYLRMLELGQVRLEPELLRHFPLEEADRLYERYLETPDSLIGAVIQYQ